MTGKFDLYSTRLPFLVSEYLPKGAKTPNFRAVYEKILFYQAKPDFSMRCALREEAGQFACSNVVNPISDEPLEPLCIVGGRTKESVKFDQTQSAHPSTVGTGWGYEAKIELDTANAGCGMITSAKGTFKLRKVWGALGNDGNESELFEGYWSLKVVYGPTLRRKGFGTGDSYGGSFWGVRALKKDGKEVGIDAGDGSYMSTSLYGLVGEEDVDDDGFLEFDDEAGDFDDSGEDDYLY
jgi:hypothetical protein